MPEPPSQRLLTADEYSRLRYQADGLAEQRTDRATVVAVARMYRGRGIAWIEIAAALGITAEELRDWRGAEGNEPKLITEPGTALSNTKTLNAGRPVHPATDRTVLFAAGNAKPSGNDFAGEAATVRARVTNHAVTIVERFNIDIAEFRRHLDTIRPAVLHLAAHSDFGGVYLSLGSSPMMVLTGAIGDAIRNSTHRPALVVLNCCHTETLARQLASPGPVAVNAVIGWRGAVTDEQACTFADQLYRRMVGGVPLGTCFDDARLIVTARWPGQAEPRLFGEEGIIPF